MEKAVLFYEPWDENGYLCNLSKYPVFYKDRLWPTAEHCYQAQKHSSYEYQERIRSCSTPEEAIKLGRDESAPSFRKDWYEVRVEIMHEVVLAKFTQNSEIRKMLLDTGDALIAEHTSNDAFWGDNLDGSGENHLGKILMSVREGLKRA